MVRFDSPLVAGRLVRRYKRFLADVAMPDGSTVTVHCPNTGAMTSCMEPGCEVLLSRSDNPQRKLPYTWELSRMGQTWVGVHSARANRWARVLIEQGHIPPLAGYATCLPEQRFEDSRLDLRLLGGPRPDAWVEVKFCTLRVGEHAAFPDDVSARGARHLHTLQRIAETRERAVALYLVGRDDCQRWRPAQEIDPVYAETLRQALEAGVELLVYRLALSAEGVRSSEALPIDL